MEQNKKMKQFKKNLEKKYDQVLRAAAKQILKLEIKLDEIRANRAKTNEVRKTKQAPTSKIQPKNHSIVLSTAGFSKEQIQDVCDHVAAIRKENEKKIRIIPSSKGQIYYTLNTKRRCIEEKISTDSTFDKFNGIIGNAFTTKNAALAALQKKKILTELERFADEHNLEITPGKYYYIFLSVENGVKSLQASEYTEKVQGAVLFSSESVANAAIKSIGENRLKRLFY